MAAGRRAATSGGREPSVLGWELEARAGEGVRRALAPENARGRHRARDEERRASSERRERVDRAPQSGGEARGAVLVCGQVVVVNAYE